MAGLVRTAIVLALGVLVPFRGKRIGFRNLAVMLRDAGIAVLDLFMLGAAAGIMIGALNYSGVGFTLTLVLILLAAEAWSRCSCSRPSPTSSWDSACRPWASTSCSRRWWLRRSSRWG